MGLQYKLAIFDMDGTILNTLEDLADSMNYALHEYGMPQRSLEEIRQFVGNGIGRLIELAVPEGTTDEQKERLHETFNSYYKVHCADKTCAYPGIKQLIADLRKAGVLTAVVSNKPDFGVQALCKDYFEGLFDFAVGEKEGIRRKPYPDSVLAVLDQFGLNQKDAVYIGDSEVDFQTSKNAGVDVIMVGWGFRDEETLRECGVTEVVYETHEVYDKIVTVETMNWDKNTMLKLDRL